MLMASVWDWGGWDAIAGVATVLLAGLTWWLAKSTRELAQETNQDIKSQWRPILVMDGTARVIIGSAVEESDQTVSADIQLTLSNRGRGPALNCVITARSDASAYGCSWGSRPRALVSVGETVESTLGGRVKKGAMAPNVEGAETIVVSYEDVAGDSFETTIPVRWGYPSYNEHTYMHVADVGVGNMVIVAT
jgi:hypothetical protein